MFPVVEAQHTKGAAQLVPVFLARAEFCTAALIDGITQIKYLMDKKGQEVQDKEIHRQVLFTVSEVMLNVIALVF